MQRTTQWCALCPFTKLDLIRDCNRDNGKINGPWNRHKRAEEKQEIFKVGTSKSGSYGCVHAMFLPYNPLTGNDYNGLHWVIAHNQSNRQAAVRCSLLMKEKPCLHPLEFISAFQETAGCNLSSLILRGAFLTESGQLALSRMNSLSPGICHI